MRPTEHATTLPWAEARARLAGDGTHWLATVRPDGRPHVVPVGAAWMDDAMYFTTGQGTRKEANVARNPHCVITISAPGYDMILEGTAAHLRDEAKLQRLAEVYRAVGWPVTGVRDGALDAPYSAPTTGPAPYEVYEVTPTTVFALGTTEATVERCTRYRFPPA
jgi:nitroimidazol reductase NimA-like FMN-containing flavoprotein (pyridoxamine 5'-phosphate oxidase superfamily)